MSETFFKKAIINREKGDQKKDDIPIDPETASFIDKMNFKIENEKIDLLGKNYTLESYGMPENDAADLFDSLVGILGNHIQNAPLGKNQILRADKLINQYVGIYGHNRVARALIEGYRKSNVINKHVKDYFKDKFILLVVNES